MEEKDTQKSGYGKRPLWQWIVIYLVIGGIAYFLIYYFVLAKKGGYGTGGGLNYGSSQSTQYAP